MEPKDRILPQGQWDGTRAGDRIPVGWWHRCARLDLTRVCYRYMTRTGYCHLAAIMIHRLISLVVHYLSLAVLKRHHSFLGHTSSRPPARALAIQTHRTIHPTQMD
ncbi:hypothetical protein N7522_001497 [Penicillium canescens]|nr:hypothetical protein N7522_001497 [Penicillium canescens]